MHSFITRKTVTFAAAGAFAFVLGVASAAESTTASDRAAERSDPPTVPHTGVVSSADVARPAVTPVVTAPGSSTFDSYNASDAARASRNIDQGLQRTASEFNDELDRATNQFHEAQRLGTSPDVRNSFGTASDIDNEINRTVDRANAQLRDAAVRDDYTFQRRELENTRNLTYPGTPEYNSLTNDIEKLDREFGNREREYVW